VYLDAVFHPLFRSQEVLFRQEGWRYELTNASDPASLNIKGVVYNEMTGSFANPYQWLYHHISAELFPNTTYAFSSGGFPWVGRVRHLYSTLMANDLWDR
jgi:Zn-dependent M16 (insulinase) family peptidase